MKWTQHGTGQWTWWSTPDGDEVIPNVEPGGVMFWERVNARGVADGVRYTTPRKAKR